MTQAAAKITAADPSEAQRRAADPTRSVWVSASAGSGKTKVLVDRVLRLLLPRADGRPGTAAHRILCLTFTKAAASEMALRLARRLGRWAVMPEDKLRAELQELLGGAASAAEVEAARRLFAAVVDAPGGLKIMTIHSFCQSVLGRFPLEAGVPPHFTGLDDAQAQALIARARDEILLQARQDPAGALGRALDLIAAETGEDGFARLLQALVKERHQLAVLKPETLQADIARAFGLSPGATIASLLAEACAPGAADEVSLRAACRVMALQGTEKTDQPRSVSIQNYLDAGPAERPGLYEAYRPCFLKQDNTPLSAPMTKALAGRYPAEDAALKAEAARLEVLEDRLKAARSSALTRALLTLGQAIIGRYETLKSARAALDFDDLINRTLALLSREAMAGWVMYKLDGGLDHILVDEAQDTNPEQWEIIRALSAEFFAGSGVREEAGRSIFSVGDEKQSIYSFQRAAPDRFRDMRAYFADRVQAAGQAWRNEPLHTSFRSVPLVLDFVDTVFAPEPVRKGLGLDPLKHHSHRQGDAGVVEVWPLLEAPEKEDTDLWQSPATVRDSRSMSARLADRIGAQIADWIKAGEILPSRGRLVRPDDVMILVRRRTAFVGQLIRALKVRGVPVSGLDRMVLKSQLAVQDLMAAAQFALLPEDDLTLACLLKSPFLGWSDARLEALAAPRPKGGALWHSLRASAAAGDAATLSWLRALIREGGRLHPYEFFSRILQEPCPAATRGGLYALRARLGEECLDPVDEFLNTTLAYEKDETPTLQGFLMEMEQGETEVKREQEEAGGRVRIMTIHGAKGLQAPIVFLPDTIRTTRTPPGASAQRLIWPDKSGLPAPVWSPRKETDCRAYRKLLDRLEDQQDEEYRRLLYVALTRAEDRLYIAGYTGHKKPHPESWYHYIAPVLPAWPGVETVDGLHRLVSAQVRAVAPATALPAAAPAADFTPPAWLFSAPEPEPLPPRPLIPSRPAGGDDEPAALSPLAPAGQAHRFRRGNLTHKLLEILPDLPAAAREGAAQAYLNRHGGDLPAAVRAEIAGETLAILNHPDWGALFGPASRAEVPVTGLLGAQLVSGQIDRMLLTATEVWIVDYKTNRPPPADEADIPPAYRRQMKAYSDIVSEIYRGRRVRCFLLWTDGPRLMSVTV